jgi:hypothetical protein
MATLTILNSGVLSLISLKGPLVEMRGAGLISCSSGGVGALCIFPNKHYLTLLFRKIFGRSQRNDISDAVKASMSVNALARQRAQRDDAAYDSP